MHKQKRKRRKKKEREGKKGSQYVICVCVIKVKRAVNSVRVECSLSKILCTFKTKEKPDILVQV